MNLLEETTLEIKLSGHKPEDIVFIGSEVSDHSCSWEEFTSYNQTQRHGGLTAKQSMVVCAWWWTPMAKWWMWSSAKRASTHKKSRPIWRPCFLRVGVGTTGQYSVSVSCRSPSPGQFGAVSRLSAQIRSAKAQPPAGGGLG